MSAAPGSKMLSLGYAKPCCKLSCLAGVPFLGRRGGWLKGCDGGCRCEGLYEPMALVPCQVPEPVTCAGIC